MHHRVNTGCDTIFNNSEQETLRPPIYSTPPIKKTFLDSHTQYPKHINECRSLFQ